MRLGIGIDVLIFWKPTRSRYTFLAADCMALEKPLTRYRHSAGGTPQGPRCDADASRRIRGVGARLASLDFAPPAPTRSLRASESRSARSCDCLFLFVVSCSCSCLWCVVPPRFGLCAVGVKRLEFSG